MTKKGITLNPGKAALIGLIAVCLTVLALAGTISGSGVQNFLYGVAIYVLGNGVALTAGSPVRPLLHRKEDG